MSIVNRVTVPFNIKTKELVYELILIELCTYSAFQPLSAIFMVTHHACGNCSYYVNVAKEKMVIEIF